jgi:hypothetical protein
MRCHSPSSQLVLNFIADRRWHTVSKPDGPMKKGALPDARFAPARKSVLGHQRKSPKKLRFYEGGRSHSNIRAVGDKRRSGAEIARPRACVLNTRS